MTNNRHSPKSWIAGVATTALLASLTLATPAHADPTPTPTPSGTENQTGETNAAERARETGVPVVVENLTTETLEVKANPDGTFTADQTRLPVRTRQDGNWIPVDTTLVSNPDGTISPTATVLPMRFSGGGTQPMILAGTGASQFSIGWPGALPTPVLETNQATYVDVLEGVDLVVTAEADSFSHVLIVKTAQAALNPALTELTFPVTTGLTVTQTSDGITVTGPDGDVVLRSTRPHMWDSTTNPAVGDTPSVEDPGSGKQTEIPTTTSGGSVIRLAPPVQALAGPGVTYPVFIDPAFETPAANWVTVTSSGTKWYNSTTEPALRVGYCNWSGCNGIGVARSYFNINTSILSGRPTAAKVFTAAIYVTQIHNAVCSPTPVDLYSANSIGSSTTWPGPAVATLQQLSSGAGVNCTTKSASLAFNSAAVVTKLQDAANGAWGYTTFGLKSPNETDANQWKKFDKNPRLSVTYGYPPNPATNLAATGATTCAGKTWAPNNPVTFTAAATDNNPVTQQVRLIFKIWRDTTIVASNTASPIATNSGTPATWATNLPDGTYTLKVTVWSGYGDQVLIAATDTAYNFTVDRTPPANPGTITSHDYPPPSDGNPIPGTPQGQGGKMILATTDPNITGFVYQWNNTTWPTPACATTKTTSLSGVTLTSNNQTTIDVPPTLTGENSLHIRAFDPALNTSETTTSYTILIPETVPGTTTTKIEAETATWAQPAAQNLLISQDGPSITWSNNYQAHIYFTAPDQTIATTLTVTLDTDYHLGIQVSKGNHNGKYNIYLDDQTIATGIDTYNPTSHTEYINLGTHTLTTGTHTLTITTLDPNPNTTNTYEQGINDNGNALQLDHIRLIPAPPA